MPQVETISIHYWVDSVDGADGIAAHARAMISTLLRLNAPAVELKVCNRRQAAPGRVRLASTTTLRGLGAVRTIFYAVGALCRALWFRPDFVLVSHVNFAPLAWIGWCVLRIPYVVAIHAHEVNDDISWIRKRALRSARFIWAVSAYADNRARAVGVSASQVLLVPNTVDYDRFRIGQKADSLLEKYGIHTEEKVVLTVARLSAAEQYKGYDRVLAALPELARRIGRVRYLLVGDGDDTRRVRQLATNLGVLESVLMPGYVPDDELAQHYQLADLFVLPSTNEGFGIVFLEAMACGIPVLGGNIDGAVTALGGGELGRLVDPMDTPQLAEAMADMLQKKGPPLWYAPEQLRHRSKELFGAEAHGVAVRSALLRWQQ